jgi:hypothetical protein
MIEQASNEREEKNHFEGDKNLNFPFCVEEKNFSFRFSFFPSSVVEPIIVVVCLLLLFRSSSAFRVLKTLLLRHCVFGCCCHLFYL